MSSWMSIDELCSFRYVDVVYGYECDVVYGYVMNYIVYGYVVNYIVYGYAMNYVVYGCECDFEFPTIQLVNHISVKNRF
jgi:hypothetical protein